MGRHVREPDVSTYRGRFGANLRELRLRKFATQDDFVETLRQYDELATVTKTTVSGWELGERIPDLDLWPIIAEVLGRKPRALAPPE